MDAEIDLADIQRIIVRGIRLQHVRHHFLTVTNPQRARRFLQEHVAARLPSAEQPPCNGQAAAVALTYSGMQALQLPDRYLSAFRQFSPAFVKGAAARAAAHLGDTGRNESPRWEEPFRSIDTHVLLTLHADQESELDNSAQQLHGGDLPATGLRGWETPMSGRHRSNQTEPFGFRDGISQPTIKGVHFDWAQYNPPSLHAEPGEFLLGYRDEDGANRWSAADLAQPVREFVRNGSFVVLRKMLQHKAAFDSLPPLVRAKMCGRWPNGALVREGEDTEPAAAPEKNDINRFDFKNDARGYGCPHASHIRRLNPRSDAVIPPRKRLLMRRGVPYEENGEVGLLGLFVCADLQRQFEFLMSEWTREAPMSPGRIAPDPLIGARGDAAATFSIPKKNGATATVVEEVKLLDAFITTRGTLYGFYPSIRALRMIASIA